jgi:antitoxin component of MazEF toxin-antitoxin module
MGLQEFEYRRIQPAGTASFALILPIDYVRKLKLDAGHYVACSCDGKRIVIEPVEGGR